MNINELDVVELKNGKKATILEIKKKADEFLFLIEIENDNEIDCIRLEDIKKVIWKAN